MVESKLKGKISEFRRGGAKGVVVKVALAEEDLGSPLRVLLDAGKVELVEPAKKKQKKRRLDAADAAGRHLLSI